MPAEVRGASYYTLHEVEDAVGVSRQTLWRWRQSGKIPAGRRYRDKQLLFTQAELEEVLEYADRFEPAIVGEARQLKLFNGGNSDEQ